MTRYAMEYYLEGRFDMGMTGAFGNASDKLSGSKCGKGNGPSEPTASSSKITRAKEDAALAEDEAIEDEL